MLLLLACASPTCDWPSAAASVPGVLESEVHTCGWWSLPAGGHLYVNVNVSAADVPCGPPTMGSPLAENASAIYSNLTDQGPKWTYDLVGVEAGETEVAISCDDGTTFDARVLVTDT